MTFVGFFGLFLGLLAAMFAFVRVTRPKVAIFCFAYIQHVAAAVAYYTLTSSVGGDSAFYYFDPANLYGEGFGLSTTFLIYVVQVPKSVLGGTYLDYFLVFQAIGFFGIGLLMRIFDEIYDELGLNPPVYIYLLLFLPGLHYWTAAIGKDSLFFCAICMTLWAAMNVTRRWIVLSAGMLLMLAIRPHVAVIAAAAFAMAVMVDRNTRPVIKVPLFVLSLAGVGFAVNTVWNTFGIDLTNVDSYTDLISGQQAVATSEAAGRTAVTGSYPVRLLSLLFRPFFFDASDVLGLIVSLENLVLLPVIGLILIHLRTTIALARNVPFLRYALVSSAVITLVLAMGYYNVGLGIRQKATMILPGFLVAFATLQALRKARQAVPPTADPVMAAAGFHPPLVKSRSGL